MITTAKKAVLKSKYCKRPLGNPINNRGWDEQKQSKRQNARNDGMKKRMFWKLFNKNAACHGLFGEMPDNATCQWGKNRQRAPL